MFERTEIFTAGEGGYYTYRIPALVATPTGTLLAFCAARRGTGGDWDPIDVVLRRSVDGGVTWDAPRALALGHDQPADNPTPIVDRVTGAVHFLYQINYARCYYIRSDDEGATWSEPRDITDVFEAFHADYPWRVLAPGPGHAIQLRNGRLVVPVWLSTGESTHFGPGKLGHRPSCVSAIYSDDHGASWQRGEIVVHDSEEFQNPSETVAVQLNDGRVLFNIRTEQEPNRRLFSWSDDGATGWTPPQYNDDLFEPVCMAGMIRLSEAPADRNRILFSNPDSHANPAAPRKDSGMRKRENLTIKMSYDEGATWPISKVLDPEIAGYSDLAIGADGTIFCIYEGAPRDNAMFYNTHISVARFDLDWLTDGADRLAAG